jgi:hypothetical protein
MTVVLCHTPDVTADQRASRQRRLVRQRTYARQRIDDVASVRHLGVKGDEYKRDAY